MALKNVLSKVNTTENHHPRRANHRQRLWMLPVLAMAAILLMGMGGGADDTAMPTQIPPRNYNVSISDQKGNTLKVQRFTWEGKVFFRAQYGSATVTLPFDKIRSVELNPKDRKAGASRISATATLKTGEKVDVAIERETKAYGETKFGAYEIFLKDVASITFE